MIRALILIGLLGDRSPGEGGPAADSIGAALHDNRWADADALAAASPDPIARKLVLYYRLSAPGGGHPAEIAAFMAANPDLACAGHPGPAVVGGAGQ